MADHSPPRDLRDLVARALAEDIGPGDVTTSAIVEPGRITTGVLIAKADLVVSGLPVARDVLAAVDATIEWSTSCCDGDRVTSGFGVATVRGLAASLLAAERTALNFLQHLSGIATLTRAFVDKAGPRTTILDTRKTVPGLRALAKYAVRCGGGQNHRFGLFDGILIKDNHIRIAGGIAEAVGRARAAGVRRIEVEAQSLADVDEALAAGVEVIMLDNFDDRTIRTAVARIGSRAATELSGNMTLRRVESLADVGATFISVGALTHSAPAVDISLELAL